MSPVPCSCLPLQSVHPAARGMGWHESGHISLENSPKGSPSHLDHMPNTPRSPAPTGLWNCPPPHTGDADLLLSLQILTLMPTSGPPHGLLCCSLCQDHVSPGLCLAPLGALLRGPDHSIYQSTPQSTAPTPGGPPQRHASCNCNTDLHVMQRYTLFPVSSLS